MGSDSHGSACEKGMSPRRLFDTHERTVKKNPPRRGEAGLAFAGAGLPSRTGLHISENVSAAMPFGGWFLEPALKGGHFAGRLDRSV